METKNKIIYTRKIAMQLIEMGHVPVGTMPNPSRPEFLTWIFAVNPKFEADLGKVLPKKDTWYKASRCVTRGFLFLK